MKRSLTLFITLFFALACQDVAQVSGPTDAPRLRAAFSSGGGPLVYVANRGGTVDIIDPASNTVTGTINHGIGDAGPTIAISPNGALAYVALGQTDQILILDLATNTVAGSIPVGFNPSNVAFTPDGTKAYVPNDVDKMSVIDVSTHTVTTTFQVGDHSGGVAVSPDGTQATVVASVSHDVRVIDVATDAVTDIVPLPPTSFGPINSAITPDGTQALSANFNSGDVSVITLSEPAAVTATIPVGATPDPVGIAISPDGTLAYVTLRFGEAMAVVDLNTNTLVGTIPLTGEPSESAAFLPDGSRAYQSVTGLNRVAAIDVATSTVIALIPAGGRPTGIAISPEPDPDGPVTSDVTAAANPAPVGDPVTVTAIIDDAATGGSDVASAEYSLDGPAGPWLPMLPSDGMFDEVGEDAVVAAAGPAVAGVYELCVRGTDARGNVGEADCILFVAYDPNGGFVTGGGWIDSPPGAYVSGPALWGKANFGFVSKYKRGAAVPTGSTEFQFKAGDLNFHGTGFDWLVVNQGGSNAQFKGSGTINGNPSPLGTEYRFMIWAKDDNPDTFRIRIWYENGGSEVDVYDNGVGQAIGGGNIKVHDGK